MADKKDDSEPNTWQEFTEVCSMHGLRLIMLPNASIFRRFVWLLLLLGMLAYFGYATEGFVRDCVEKKVTTRMKIANADKLTFPTVTICNKNMWMKGSLEHTSSTMKNDALIEIFNVLFRVRTPNDSRLLYNWSDPYYSEIVNLTGSDSAEFLRQAAPQLSYSITNCAIQGEFYDCSSMFKTVITDAGYCYQFNSDGNIKAKSTGVSSGISLVLNAVVDQYAISPNSYSEGFFIAFHEPHEVPSMTELSVGVAPGTENTITLHKSESVRFVQKLVGNLSWSKLHSTTRAYMKGINWQPPVFLQSDFGAKTIREPPYADAGEANCFDTNKLPNPLQYYTNYSYTGCMAECKAAYVINACGCRDFRLPALNGVGVCSLTEMMDCSYDKYYEFVGAPDGLELCNCSNPCNEVEYSATMSAFKFPSTIYANDEAADSQYLSDNYLLVNIFYGKLSYFRLEESVTYSFVDMVANIGGTLGCCIGASVLSICEFVDLAFVAIARRLSRSNRTKRVGQVVQVASYQGNDWKKEELK